MPKVATSNHPLLRQLLRPRQRAGTKEKARARLQHIGKLFIQSKDGRSDDGFRLWVRGYGLTKQEREAGYTGNFVIFHIVEDPDGHRIVACKEQVELAQHPERVRTPTGTMPNWGFPVLRSVKKERLFYSKEEAEAHLQELVDAYPKSVKQKGQTTKAAIYIRHPEIGPMVEKILLRIEEIVVPEVSEDEPFDPWAPIGGWQITYIPDPSSPAAKVMARLDAAEEADEPMGEFAKKALAGKKRKVSIPGVSTKQERQAKLDALGVVANKADTKEKLADMLTKRKAREAEDKA